MNDKLSWKVILGFGLLPVALLVAFDFMLGEASRGKGGFEAAWLIIVGIFIVPGLLIANCWLFFVNWSGRTRVFFAGLALPTVMGAAQTELLYGPREFDRWVNAVLTAWPALLWVFLVLFFLPLLTLLVRSVLHRMQ